MVGAWSLRWMVDGTSAFRRPLMDLHTMSKSTEVVSQHSALPGASPDHRTFFSLLTHELLLLIRKDFRTFFGSPYFLLIMDT
ncbi:hypothetical protein TNCV_3793971 [Trichonephila clavipes]|nr:hypothetical protein TNCV_3793971 [Trichonephila clavipes]